MELKIIDKKDNLLFNRKEIEASVGAEVTPRRQEIKELISEKLSIPPEVIKLKGIHGKFGSKNFTIKANVYNSIEDKEKIEPKSKKEKEEEKKAAEQATAEETQVQETSVENPKKVEDTSVTPPTTHEETSNDKNSEDVNKTSENKSEPSGEANKTE